MSEEYDILWAWAITAANMLTAASEEVASGGKYMVLHAKELDRLRALLLPEPPSEEHEIRQK